MKSITKFDWSYFNSDDLVVIISHASYEFERSLKIIESIPNHFPLLGSIICATSTTISEDENYRKSLDKLNSSLAQIKNSPAPINVICDRSDLLGYLRMMELKIRSIDTQGRPTFLIDISVFPKDRLFLILDLIDRVSPEAKIVLGYTEPRSYDTENNNDGWLSKGVVEVVSLPGFNGRQDPIKKPLLVMIIGHETERMSITINNREPQRLILIAQGTHQTSRSIGNHASKTLNKIRSDYGSIIDEDSIVYVSSRDIQSVRESILGIERKYCDEYNISVAFLGTKLQAIGALLACQLNRSIEAVYAQPQIYHRDRYSLGTKDSYMVDLS